MKVFLSFLVGFLFAFIVICIGGKVIPMTLNAFLVYMGSLIVGVVSAVCVTKFD